MNITEILEVIISLVATILAVFVIPVIKNRYSAESLENALKWVDIAVAAAEQLYESTQGAEKKEYVFEFLAEKGLIVDENELDMAIEAAVNRLHNELYGGIY